MKKRAIFIIGMLLGLLSSSLVYAIGISPANIQVEFAPHSSVSVSIFLFNTGLDPINATLSAGGDLAPFVSYEKSASYLLDSGASQQINLTFSFPETLEPGPHRLLLIAKQIPFGSTSSGLAVSAEISSFIDTFVPYPGTYASLSLSGKDVNTKEPLIFSLRVHNLGKRIIDNFIAYLALVDYQNTPLDSFTHSFLSLSPGEERTFSVSLNGSTYGPGHYKALAFGKYNTIRTPDQELAFRIGQLSVNITNITFDAYGPMIYRFSIALASIWNSPLDDVHAQTTIFNEQHQSVGSLTTPNAIIGPWGQTTLSAFWDAQDITPGRYTADVHVLYKDKETALQFPFTIPEPPRAIDSAFIIIFILVVIILFDYFWLRGKNKNKKPRRLDNVDYDL